MDLDLKNRISSIFDYAYANSSIRVPAITCREVGKILHVGMFIEEAEKRIPAFSFSYDILKTLNGSENAESKKVAREVNNYFSKMNEKWKLYDEEIRFSPKEIAYIVSRLSGLYISDPKTDVFGDALEIFRSTWAKQEGGQFFTDQKVTRLAIEMLEFHPEKGDDLLDVCAGTGGFLLAAFNKIKDIVTRDGGDEKKVIQTASKSIKGIEIDSEVASLGNGTLTARTGRYNLSIISTANSLDVDFCSKQKIPIKESEHLCIATNPPFGAKTPVRDVSVLRHYELARLSNGTIAGSYKNRSIQNRSPDILFMERNVKLLKPGAGRAAIVTPYQILSGPQTQYIRDWLIRNCQIIAIVDLPSETFQPHTGTKTSLVVVKRRKNQLLRTSDASDDPDIFMATPRWIGHDRRGNTVYKMAANGQPTATVLTDFPEIEEAYEAFRKGKNPSKFSKNAFTVSIKKILHDQTLRINAQSYKPATSTHSIEALQTADFEVRKLGDCVERIFYPGRFKRNYVDHYEQAVPFFGGSNITEIVAKTEKWLRHDDPKLSSLTVDSGWLLVTRSGTTGVISSVPSAWKGFAISEHVIRIVPDPSKLDPNYLLAFMRSKNCQEQLKRGIFGSVIDEISPEFISQIDVLVPKNKKYLNKIALTMKAAEEARNTTITNIQAAVAMIDQRTT